MKQSKQYLAAVFLFGFCSIPAYAAATVTPDLFSVKNVTPVYQKLKSSVPRGTLNFSGNHVILEPFSDGFLMAMLPTDPSGTISITPNDLNCKFNNGAITAAFHLDKTTNDFIFDGLNNQTLIVMDSAPMSGCSMIKGSYEIHITGNPASEEGYTFTMTKQ